MTGGRIQNNARTIRPPIAILGVPFDNVTAVEAVEMVEAMVASRQPHYLVTANVDFLVQARRDIELRRILYDSHLVLCDGTPVLWASRFLGNALPERVAGADLVPLLIAVAAQKGYRLFFLGASPQSSSEAVTRLQKRYPEVRIAGHYSPPYNQLMEMDHGEIRRRILSARPDMLFVSFGCPKQEKWVAMHYRVLGVPVVAGVGATIDFLAGRVKRAPDWMQRTGTEWLFRLAQEPRRLLGRYSRDLVIFGANILPQWWQMQARRHFRRFSVSGQGNLYLPRKSTSPTDGTAVAFQSHQLPERFDCAAAIDFLPLAESINADGRNCFLELNRVRFIDSTGVSLLIRLNKALESQSRHLVLLAPSTQVRRVLQLMQLHEFVTVADNELAACELLAKRGGEVSRAVRPSLSGEAKLSWHGEVTAANAEQVWEATRARLSELPPCAEWAVDLSDLRFLDSTGLGLMVRTRKFAENCGARVVFLNPQPAVRNVLRLAHLEAFLLEGGATAAPPNSRIEPPETPCGCAPPLGTGRGEDLGRTSAPAILRGERP